SGVTRGPEVLPGPSCRRAACPGRPAQHEVYVLASPDSRAEAALSAATVRGEGAALSPDRRTGPGFGAADVLAAGLAALGPRGAIGLGAGLPAGPGRADDAGVARGADGLGAGLPAGPGRADAGADRGALGLGAAGLGAAGLGGASAASASAAGAPDPG